MHEESSPEEKITSPEEKITKADEFARKAKLYADMSDDLRAQAWQQQNRHKYPSRPASSATS